MANHWLRLWHDMPNDPKWRTIARVSGQSIALTQAVYLQLLVDASRNVTRGHVDVTTEDISSALDVHECDVQAVLDAMQGRVMNDKKLTGWERRQPKREDEGNPETGAKSALERKRAQRERDKQAKQKDQVTQRHDLSREVTLDKYEEKEFINKGNAKKQSQKKSPAFKQPTEKELMEFALTNNLNLSGMFDYYQSNGWMVGKNKMKDWKAAARNWHNRQSTFAKPNQNEQPDRAYSPAMKRVI